MVWLLFLLAPAESDSSADLQSFWLHGTGTIWFFAGVFLEILATMVFMRVRYSREGVLLALIAVAMAGFWMPNLDGEIPASLSAGIAVVVLFLGIRYLYGNPEAVRYFQPGKPG